MIAHLSGLLTHLEPTHLVIECAGVGYLARISLHTFQQLQGKKEARVLTVVQYKDDGQALFGFAQEEERSLFEKLLSVQGVGGAVALSLLSAYNPTLLGNLITSQDTAALKKVKGVGSKTAERIVLELKDKLEPGSETSIGSAPNSAVRAEALQALATLGYPKQQVVQKVDEFLQANPALTVEALIKAVLRG